MSKADGGAAFPAQPIMGRNDGSWISVEQGGMTLRQWYKGQIAAGPLASSVGSGEEFARKVGELADALLAEDERA